MGEDVPEYVKRTFDRLGIPEAEKKYLGGVGVQYDSEVVYHNQLEDLHNWILTQLEEIPQADRKLVTDHLFMGYFTQRYDFEIINALLPAFSSAASPSAQELAGIQDSIRQSGVEVIFIGISSNRRIAEQVAGDTSVAVVPLYTGSLSELNGPADTYLSFMQYNVRAIATALK